MTLKLFSDITSQNVHNFLEMLYNNPIYCLILYMHMGGVLVSPLPPMGEPLDHQMPILGMYITHNCKMFRTYNLFVSALQSTQLKNYELFCYNENLSH